MFKPYLKTIMSVILSATMALPAQVWSTEETVPEATDGLPVFLQDAMIGGKRARIAMAFVPQDAEPELVTRLASEQPERTILEVAGPEDPALKAAAKTGMLGKIRTFVVGKLEQSPMFQVRKVSKRLKDKIKAKVDRLDAFLDRESVGVMVAVSTAGINGGYTAYTSSSVGAGMAVFSKLALWNALIITKPELWSKALDLGGNGTIKLAAAISGLFGRELTETDTRLYDLVGKFAVSWMVNSVMAGMIKAWSGDLNGLSMGWMGLMSDVADAGWSGIQNNTNVWDIPVLRAYKEGKFSRRTTQLYFIGQQIIFAFFEIMAYSGVPYMPIFLSTVTASGLVFLALSKEKQNAIGRHAKKLRLPFKYGMARIKRQPSYSSRCHAALSHGVPLDIAHANAVWEDTN